ncbi:MAG: hypothetical protein ACI8XO_002016 [Verrucomicrobiales bacterium]|jgi:hypothetical protein
MKKPQLLLTAVTLIASASLASAQAQGQGQQNNQNNQNNNQSQSGEDEVQTTDDTRKFFQVKLSDGGAYMVALGRITSIAKHEYIVDANVRVNEVSITAEGSTITRFYFLEPASDSSPSGAGQVLINRAKDTVKKVAQRTGTTDALNAVSKSYPHGTHTHNIEYRLRNKANVNQLYSALQSAWYNGKGKIVSVQVKK